MMEHRIEPPLGSRPRRLAVLASIALAGLLIPPDAAMAASPSPLFRAPNPDRGGRTAAAEPEEEVEWEWGEEEEEEEEEEEVELELEEGEEEIEVELEFEEEAPRATPRPGRQAECALRDASARVVASDTSDSLHLSLRYVSPEPVRVEVHYSVDGVRGATRLDPMTLRATRHGRIDYTEHPGGQRMSKLRTAHTLVVTLEASGASRFCRRHSTKRLTSKQHGHGRTVWSEASRHPRARS
jgi:hypothetical protein